MLKRVHFPSSLLPYLLVAPQILITLVFFIWPASQAVYQSFLIEDAFGLSTEFVWFENFELLIEDAQYLQSFGRTILFSAAVAVLSMGSALILAGFADRVVRGATTYRTLMIWPYAVAPVLAGALWVFMFNPTLGIFPFLLDMVGIDWNHYLNGTQAMTLVIFAAAWKQIAYNFLFYLAAMQSIPRSLIEAAAIDGAGPVRRFVDHIFPLISPTTFFLLVINAVYAFFDTFGIIHAVTQGGPANSTTILVYKVYNDGFVGLDLGGSAAQSVILMILVIAMTVVQFRFIERKVEY
ncbi:sn-glycerol-3-phosphate ABC transporter permease UgpA [Ruegeria pomeroyi]|jgi:sn-glycerol 3-phosphate transport system permease protein|nr:sn-glycerol-3-phosphate ABC transporter permease UgpA [Ruegeria pomeroyi]NVK96628.1 sn-glycerol-3-phosphate ABC transporter permease UgpA [Ruegeria pomeroyi]NVL02210.1 sn-glycerol-3-phosphate ABC transporter permease UgpA [Ruegeria pomeroyi]QWV10852.1 sn-glycerol-3-phosphate ABC transporter permease UgpA [Ruegeria pomeroyi]HCE72430.1 sn-glycerol-3-phosphate ABC transporter permease UgpA [Ruegeria sp.]